MVADLCPAEKRRVNFDCSAGIITWTYIVTGLRPFHRLMLLSYYPSSWLSLSAHLCCASTRGFPFSALPFSRSLEACYRSFWSPKPLLGRKKSGQLSHPMRLIVFFQEMSKISLRLPMAYPSGWANSVTSFAGWNKIPQSYWSYLLSLSPSWANKSSAYFFSTLRRSFIGPMRRHRISSLFGLVWVCSSSLP